MEGCAASGADTGGAEVATRRLFALGVLVRMAPRFGAGEGYEGGSFFCRFPFFFLLDSVCTLVSSLTFLPFLSAFSLEIFLLLCSFDAVFEVGAGIRASVELTAARRVFRRVLGWSLAGTCLQARHGPSCAKWG